MSALPALSGTTARELASPAPPGSRHAQIVRVALRLLREGLNPAAAFCQLRPMYAADVPDGEIRRAIEWAESKQPGTRLPRVAPRGGADPKARRVDPAEAIQRFLEGFACAEADLWEASPLRPPDDWRDDWRLFLESVYAPDERLNVVTDYARSGQKATPTGKGRTLTRGDWLHGTSSKGVPEGLAGAWLRMNPLSHGGITDADVAAFRFVLLEIDALPLPLQLSFFARLPLPISAIITSGGRSLHAWVRVDAPNRAGYVRTVSEMFRLLAPFGVDCSNRNPSRLARLPGAARILGAIGDGRQRLLYLNPFQCQAKPIL